MKRETGFTLLEVLVVITLMGLLLGLVGTAVVAGGSAVQSTERASARLDDIRATQRFLRQSIGQALPLRVDDGLDGPAVSFQGERDWLSFYAPLPASLGGGIYRQRLVVDGSRLEMHLARLVGQQLEPWGEAQPLLEAVTQAHFSYRGRSPLGEPTGWLDSWPWPDRLPRSIRLDLRLSGAQPWVRQHINVRLDLSGEGA